MKKSRITIKDLAKQLNISTSTVSRALRDHPEINPKTKKAVLELAQELDYQPDLVSLSLLQKKTNTIGVIVPKMGYHFFSEVMDGIEEVTSAAGYTVLVCQTNESVDREILNTKQLTARRVDGFLISICGETSNFDHFRYIQKQGIPLVFFDRECEEMDTSKVLADNYNAIRQAVEHLIDEGCKRIAFMAGPEKLSLSNSRLQGYTETLEKHGMSTPKELVTHCDFSEKDTIRATNKLLELDKKPDAIIAMSDRIAYNAMKAIKEKGLRIPEDIAIVGFNDEPVDTLINPPLSSIKLSEYQIGKQAAEILLREIDAEDELTPEIKMLPTELIVRESSMKKKR
ncbi:LacI family DNA-binding transcriptional regulator [Flammeovirgaceae bacterium SG7u.111]|nr:LacI family DNA-binding transcriptional regulator [Flammeovirgaceae bacterium SG7u.132]WPO35112.1 LacI family DNA-binding transcriptional regulator [Flammeovirgaceae bacterium SG7u.111]